MSKCNNLLDICGVPSLLFIKSNQMDLIWNEFELKKPPLTTAPVKKVDFSIPDLRKILDQSVAFYESQVEFEETAALCSRLLAKRKNSFKKMAGFKAFCKLNTALCRLLRLDIKILLSNFLGLLPEYQSTSKFGTHLPSRANLDYVLIRLIGLQKIYVRILNCCEDVARYFGSLLSKNFYMDTITLTLSTVSSIWKLTIKLGNHTGKLYETLLGFRDCFPQSGGSWLPSDFNFPEKLDHMRTVDAALNLPRTVETKKLLGDPKLEMRKMVLPKQITQLSSSVAEGKPGLNLALDLDIGVEISRDSLEPTFDLSKCNNIQAIFAFFQAEDKLRQSGLRKCITKNISDNDWNKLKKRINSEVNSDNRKAVKIFMSVLKNKI